MKTPTVRFLICFLSLIFLLPQAHAQPRTKSGKVFIYKAIITTDTGYKLKGWLYDADDMQLYLVSEKLKLKANSLASIEPTMTLQADQIKTLKIRRKGSYPRAAMRGALIGVGAGLAMGLAVNAQRSGNEEYLPREVAGLGLIGGFYFGLLGTPFGQKPAKQFQIKGNTDTYRQAKDLIRAYSIKAQMNKG